MCHRAPAVLLVSLLSALSFSPEPPRMVTVTWDASGDTNVSRYCLREAAKPYTTPEQVYWTTNTSLRVPLLTNRVSWFVVQAFTPWGQSAFSAGDYVRFPGVSTNTNCVVVVSGADWAAPTLRGPWEVNLEGTLSFTNPPRCGFFMGPYVSITNWCY